MTRKSLPASRSNRPGNNRDVTAYLADILARIHDHKINRLDDLLPWNWSPPPSVLHEAA